MSTRQEGKHSYRGKNKKKEASFNGRRLDVDMESFLSQHDIVYLTPGTEGFEGFPLGNGDLGTMVWTPSDRIHFQINKCNTWDDAPPGSFGARELHTNLRHCGEIQIEPGLPVFDWMYLKDFEGRLSLAHAEANFHARGPLGEVKCRAFVAREPRVLIISYQDKLSEPVKRKVKLARWGSRIFEHWYNIIKRQPALGLTGTHAGSEKSEVWIEQSTRSLRFSAALKIEGTKVNGVVYNKRTAGFEIDAKEECAFTLYLAVLTSEEAEDPLSKARETVQLAAKEGVETISKRHKHYWAGFWSRSFVDLSEDYLENLWYINVYQVASSSQGAYPPHFINSLWSWNRDIRPWNHFYHWNQQMYTWPLHTSGHPELILPYCKWRLEGLPHAIEDAKRLHGYSGVFYNAKRLHGYSGAFYTDIANRCGCQSAGGSLRYNLTPGPQIAMDMWRHYQYTLDNNFLRKYAYPVMREVVRFYLDYLVLLDDGKYHIPISSPYESSLRCQDTTSDLACIQQLFPAFIKAAEQSNQDSELNKQCTHVLANLADYVTMDLPEGATPLGEAPPGTRIVVHGRDPHSGLPIHRWDPERGLFVGHPASVAPIFPAGIVGLDQRGSEDFALWERTLRCFHADEGSGHRVYLIAQARMGLSDLLETSLREWPEYFQLFPQGFFCYFRRDTTKIDWNCADHNDLSATNLVRIQDSPILEQVNLPQAPFAHMSLEPGSLLETAINEMLLQSYSGPIRVFPSMPKGWEGRFSLHAIGGFVVTSELSAGDIKYVAVESTLGQPCRVVNPWNATERVYVVDISTNTKIIPSSLTEEIRFTTERGHIYVIERTAQPLSSFSHKSISGKPNNGPKQLGLARIGKSRQF